LLAREVDLARCAPSDDANIDTRLKLKQL